MIKSSAKEIISLYETIKSDRDLYYGLWEDCRFYYDSEKQNQQPNNKGSKNTENYQPVNPVGYEASLAFASGLFSHTYNPGDQFFTFKVANNQIEDTDLMEDWAVSASKTCLENLVSSNFGTVAYSMLLNYARLNTGVIYQEWNNKKGLVFKEIPVTNCCIAEDFDGYVDTLIREFELTAKQAYEKWGDDCHNETINAAQDPKRASDKITYLHAVMPRESYKVGSYNKMDMPIKSCYVNKDKQHITEEGGYTTFPYAVPRVQKNNNTPYGRGMSFAALDTMRHISRLTADIDDGVEMGINPPLFYPGSMEEESIDLTPGAVNHVSQMGEQPWAYPSNLDLNAADARETRKEEEIRKLFYNHVFALLDQERSARNITATEIDARMAEKVQALVPIVNRLFDEFYSMVLIRTLHILIENGEIEDPPEENIKNLRVEYSTKLDQKLAILQDQQILQALTEVQGVIAGLTEMPGLDHYVHIDKIIKSLLRSKNINPDYIKTEDETEDSKAAEAEAKQQMMQQQQLADSIAPVDPNKAPEEGSIADQMGQL